MGNLPDGQMFRTERVFKIDGRLWYVVLHWGEIEGRAEVIGIETWSRPPYAPRVPDYPIMISNLDPTGAPITTEILRQLNFGSLITAARQDAVRMSRSIAEQPVYDDALRQQAAEDAARFSRPGRPAKYDRRHFEEVARVYQAAVAEGRKPTRAVQRQFDVSASQAARWVHIARHQYGLLPPTSSGRASGLPELGQDEATTED
jgi:transposase-like protein